MSESNISKGLLDLQVNEEVKSNFLGLAQWTNYAAIIGLIGALLGFIGAYVESSKMGDVQGPGVAGGIIGGLIVMAISLYLNFTLLNASKKIKAGVSSAEQGSFNDGLSKLTTYFKVIGILVIILLVFVALAVLLAIFGAATQ